MRPHRRQSVILLVEVDAPTSWRLQDALARAGFQVTAARRNIP
jgi:DNA-binding response OmpR family regulator